MVKEERRLQAEIGALLKRADAVDEAEDARSVRTLAATSCRRSSSGARTGFRAAKARLAAEQRAMDDARGRKPGQLQAGVR